MDTVQPLQTLTKPMGNTKLSEPVWFVCTMANASMHRPDGKKLPFVNGFFKALFEEDVNYIDNEIDSGDNPYVRRANAQEREQARMMEDPLGVIKDQLTPGIRKEVEESLTIDDLEALLAQKRAKKGMEAVVEHEKNAANSLGGAAPIPGVAAAIPADETPLQRAQRLANAARAEMQKNPNAFTPGSTANVPGADSNSPA